MTSTFDKDTALQAILYAAHHSTDRRDMHRIFKILYFADREHLAKYGRSITGDTYIAMNFGPVPSNIDDIFKAVRGDSYFSSVAGDLKTYFHFINKYIIAPDKQPDMDYLSETDVECLDLAVEMCKNKTFGQLTELSHDLAWRNTNRDREMSVKDIMRENGETEEYAAYIHEKLQLESAF